MKNAKRQVAHDIANAFPQMTQGGGGSGGAGGQPPPQPPEYLTKRFSVRGDGVWMARQEDKPELWVCSRLLPLAETTDEFGTFGMLWCWTDRDGTERREVFERRQFSGDGGDMRAEMASRGLTFNASRDARQAFAEYINIASSVERMHVVYRTGWHMVHGKRIFVLPDHVFGTPVRPVFFHTTTREPSMLQQAGTLAEWRSTIGAACIGNSRLCLAVCIAFAAPLLYLLGEDGGGVNLYGKAQSGKTTCARASASVCGGDPTAGGAKAYLRTWRATSNSMEGVAALHSDVGMVMDELGQSNPKEIGETQYMLAGGQGKSRSSRDSNLRGVTRFRSLYLSTGEVTLAEKVAEAGGKIKAGQGVRLVDVPVNAGKGLGAFEDIQDADSIGAFVEYVGKATDRYYGTPFRAFIVGLFFRLDRDAGFVDTMRGELARIMATWLEPLGTHDGQVRSVARRFAVIALGGNLATQFHITGWGMPPEGGTEAECAAHACFTSWLHARGTTGSHEDAQAVIQLRAFVSLHGGSRFDDWGDRVLAEGEQPDLTAPPPMQKFRTVSRAGWRRYVKSDRPGEGGTWHYFFSTEGMREAMLGLDYKAALKVLADRGLILSGQDGAKAKSLTVPGCGKQRLYEVPSSVISATVGIGFDGED